MSHLDDWIFHHCCCHVSISIFDPLSSLTNISRDTNEYDVHSALYEPEVCFYYLYLWNNRYYDSVACQRVLSGAVFVRVGGGQCHVHQQGVLHSKQDQSSEERKN